MNGFRFAYPWIFALLPLWLLLFWWMRRQQQKRVSLRFSSLQALQGVPQGWRVRLARTLPLLLRWLALLLGLVALARPQSVVRKQWFESTGVDIVLSLDTSGSMKVIDMDNRGGLVQDIHQQLTNQGVFDFGTARNDALDRLDVVKLVAQEFVRKRKGDRVSLVIFGTEARTLCPLTHDLSAVSSLLRDVQIGQVGQNTDLRKGIELGLKRLVGLTIEDVLEMAKTRSKDYILEQVRTRKASFLFDKKTDELLKRAKIDPAIIEAMRARKPRSQILILLTDGKHTAKPGAEGREEVLRAAQDAALYKIKIYTVGIGSKKAYTFLRIKRSGRDNVVRFPSDSYDEDLMREVSKITKGRFFSAQDRKALKQVYADINKLEPNRFKVRQWDETKERYIWFLLPMLGLLGLALLLNATLFRRIP
ncbi:MAG: VWA domain-containing protein [Myxococcales bacterium]|nr:VWA domain-containing protein [Myxococcales bacterium]MCB9643222.1 VWA domain-containing protein [Myxococcales bacterium]